MDRRLSLVTLGVSDLARAEEFYTALGWQRGNDVLDEARAAGGTVGREGAETFWGGYSGIFVDPDGHPWEVAHNPFWTVTEDGRTLLGTS